MKLLLTSSGLRNNSLQDALRNMLDKPTDQCNFVFITTGASGSHGDKTWLVHDIANAHGMGWKSFEMLDVALTGEWDKEIWWSIIEQADVIQVGGGNSGYLSYWLQRSGVFDAMPELLKHKVYVGISAGSMMATSGLNVSSGALKNELEPYEFPLNDPTVPACQVSRLTLGFTDFLFRPHWGAGGRFKSITEDSLRKASQALGKPIYLVDDETGLQVINGHVSVVTEGKWLLIGTETID